MPYGFMGKILKVDLSTGKHDYIELKESVVRKYLGGSGPAALNLKNFHSRSKVNYICSCSLFNIFKRGVAFATPL